MTEEDIYVLESAANNDFCCQVYFDGLVWSVFVQLFLLEVHRFLRRDLS